MRPALAVAANSLRELLRRPSSYLFLALVGAAALFLPRLAAGGGTLRTRLQVAAVWGIGPAVALAALGIVGISANALAKDFETRRIQTVLSKPCSAAHLFAGKLLGAAAAVLALLALVFAAFAANVLWLRFASGAPAEEERIALERFFTPRAALAPKPLAAGEAGERIRIPPGGHADLVFERAGSSRAIARAGDPRPLILSVKVHWSPPGEGPRAASLWEVRRADGGGAEGPPSFSAHEDLGYGAPREIAIPAAAVSGASRLVVRAVNPAQEAEGAVFLLEPADVALLVPRGSFWPSALVAFALLAAQLVLLAALTLFASSLFSFGTAMLFGLFVYFADLASGLLREILEDGSAARGGAAIAWATRALSAAGRAILSALPCLGGFEPVDRLAAATVLPAGDLLGRLGWILLVETGIVVLVSAVLLSRREAAGGAAG
ncbi:MAG: hypothetical protein ACUVYA_12400 [Planctomycetota bacterium]